jgi:protein-disulfide isomerase
MKLSRVVLGLAAFARLAMAEDSTPVVTIQVFSDFQCPFCKQFAPAIRELQSKGIEGIKTNVEFKNFPLGFHPFAQLAAEAVVAAGEQGKFWEMHDVLFANQSALRREDLLKYAETLKLDMGRFTQDLDSDGVKKKIEADKAPRRRCRGRPHSSSTARSTRALNRSRS